MKNILLTQFGSHVYGTNVEGSDLDYKAIFIPDVKNILLQTAPRTIVESTKSDKTAKNTAADIDTESFALHQYLKLLMEGQTVAIDILFTPNSFHKKQFPPNDIWQYIQDNKAKFLHRGTASFVGYARQQAAKYGIKGSRIAAVRAIIDYLSTCKSEATLEELFPKWILPMCLANEHTFVITIKNPKGIAEPHLQVCNRKIPLKGSVKYALAIFQKIFNEYGHRALLAEHNAGIDWKALMHAVRVSCQAYELLNTGNVTFPRPEADVLLKIRKGEMPYKEVADLIEQGLDDLEVIKLKSSLREKPDVEFANGIIEHVYSQAVIHKYLLGEPKI